MLVFEVVADAAAAAAVALATAAAAAACTAPGGWWALDANARFLREGLKAEFTRCFVSPSAALGGVRTMANIASHACAAALSLTFALTGALETGAIGAGPPAR